MTLEYQENSLSSSIEKSLNLQEGGSIGELCKAFFNPSSSSLECLETGKKLAEKCSLKGIFIHSSAPFRSLYIHLPHSGLLLQVLLPV